MTETFELPLDTRVAAADDAFAFPALLVAGPDAVSAPGSEQICATVVARLADIARKRGFPLHTAVAFNALHWDFDVETCTYSDPAHLDVLAAAAGTTGTIRPGGELAALPIGVFAEFTVGNRSEILVEIVAKDGRTPSGDNGIIDRSSVGGPSSNTVSEAWLLEPLESAPRWTRKLINWTDTGHLDPTGLAPVAAWYDSVPAANDDDIAFFVRWMVDHAAGVLAAGPLGSSLDERPDPTTRSGRERLIGALVSACAAIDAILTSSDEFARWGDYWIPVEWLDDIDQRPHRAFGRSDLEAILGQLARCGAPGAGWATLGPRLGELAAQLQSTDQRRGGENRRLDGSANDGERPYYAKNWLKVTATSSRWLADTITNRNGVVAAGEHRRYLRIDDRWPWGGAWISSPVPGPDSILWSWPADEPLWIGRQSVEDFEQLWAIVHDTPDDDTPDDGIDETDTTTVEPADDEAFDDTDDPVDNDHPAAGDTDSDTDDRPGTPGDQSAPEPADQDPEPDDEPGAPIADEAPSDPEPETREEEIADTYVEGTIVLRATDIDHGTLKLTERFYWFLERLTNGFLVFVRLNHDGDIDDDQLRQQLDTCSDATAGRLDWPIDFFPGIHLHVTGIPNLPTLFVSTRRNDDGTGFIADPPHGATPSGRHVTLAGLAIDALRRVGRSSYGTKRASAVQIAAALFGSDCPDLLRQAVGHALDALCEASKLARLGTEYSIADTAPDPTRTRFVPAGRASYTPELRDVRAHIVPPFLRRLPPGWHASYAQEHLYQSMYGRPLPAGYTFVREHQRGEHASAWRSALIGTRTDTGVITEDAADGLITYVFERQRK